jgi:hypothetical protein
VSVDGPVLADLVAGIVDYVPVAARAADQAVAPLPPSRVSLPSLPVRVSLPPRPSSSFWPELPVILLARALPVPSM